MKCDDGCSSSLPYFLFGAGLAFVGFLFGSGWVNLTNILVIGFMLLFGVLLFLLDRHLNRAWWDYMDPPTRAVRARISKTYIKDMMHAYEVACELGDTVTAEQLKIELTALGLLPEDKT